ncbi:MAG: Chloride channel core [Prosthecobacter sp.]|nr:Chloride channel core [Prosthecobacter sp.]
MFDIYRVTILNHPMPVQSNLTAEAGAVHPGAPVRLADFTTWPRALLISMAAVIMGAISSAGAYALLWLISVITSLAFSSAGLRCLPHRRAVMLGFRGLLRCGRASDGALHPDRKLSRRSQHITCEYSIDPFEFARVQDVMDHDVPPIPAYMTLPTYTECTARGERVLAIRQATLLLDDQQQLACIITRAAILSPRMRLRHEETIRQKG